MGIKASGRVQRSEEEKKREQEGKGRTGRVSGFGIWEWEMGKGTIKLSKHSVNSARASATAHADVELVCVTRHFSFFLFLSFLSSDLC